MRSTRWVRENSTATGVILIAAGVLLLLALRFFASPLARYITDSEPPGFLAFIGIPIFFLVVGVGIALFLWEPTPETNGEA